MSQQPTPPPATPQPAPPLPTGELPYDAYPAPAGGVFEQASHESIAPVPAVDQTFGLAPYGENEPVAYGVDPAYGADQAYGVDPAYAVDPRQGSDPGYGTDPAYGAELYQDPRFAEEAVQDFGDPSAGVASPSRPAVVDPGVRRPGPGVPRWGQLSYTSFDRPGERGGWQVKQTLGELDETETALLRDAVQTQFDSGVELPSFPTPEDIARLPRRMAWAPLGPRAAALWHTTPAGMDASGRPGNVFAHVLLDRDRTVVAPVGEGLGRPADLWRSPDWRTPFGADEVRGTDLPPHLPRPAWLTAGSDSPVPDGAARTVSFLTDPQAWRLGGLAVLLDACAAAMRGGPPVVLVCADVDRAAAWIAAVTQMLTPDRSRELFFSTLERAAGLATAFARGIQLACVPALDAEAVLHIRQAHRCVVLNETETPQLGDFGHGPHRTAAGDEVTVTAWSGLVLAVLANPVEAVHTLAWADELASRRETSPTGNGSGEAEQAAAGDAMWSLAMAVAQRGEVHADGLDEAAHILGSGAPASVLADDDLRQVTERVVAEHLGSGTADAWRACEDGGSDIVERLYLRRAVGDLEWLARPEGVPMPKSPVLEPEDPAVDRARTMATDLRDMAVADPRTAAVAALRLADLTAATGIIDEEMTEALDQLASATVMPQLAADTASMVAAVGPLGEGSRALLVSTLERDTSWTTRPLGGRLPRTLLQWLFPDGVQAPHEITQVDQAIRLQAEVATHLVRHQPDLLPLVVRVALADGAPAEQLRPWFAQPWPVDQLVALQQAHPDDLPAEAWLATIKSAEDSPTLAWVCQNLGGNAWQTGQLPASPVAALAGLRLVPAGWSRLAHKAQAITAVLAGASAGQQLPKVPYAASAGRTVQLAVVLAIADPSLVGDYATEQWLESLRPLFEGQRITVDDDLVAEVTAHVRTADLAGYVARLARADQRFGLQVGGAEARLRWLERTRADGSRVLRKVLRDVLREGPGDAEQPDRAPVADRAQVTSWAREAVRQPGEDGRTVDRWVAEWITEILGPEGGRRGHGRPEENRRGGWSLFRGNS